MRRFIIAGIPLSEITAKPRRTRRKGSLEAELAAVFRAGQRAAERGQSRESCNYSNPAKVEAWLRGFEKGKQLRGRR